MTLTLPRLQWPPTFWLRLQCVRQEGLRDGAREHLRYLYELRRTVPHDILAAEAREWRHENQARALRAEIALRERA